MAFPPDGDDCLATLRREYVDGLRETLAALEAAIAAQDHTEIRRLAHQTRGAAGMYGYPELSETAGLLEDAIHEGRDASLIRDLAGEFCRGMRAISGSR